MPVIFFIFCMLFICSAKAENQGNSRMIFDVKPLPLSTLVGESEYSLSGTVKSKKEVDSNGLTGIKYIVQVDEWFKGKSNWINQGNDPKVFHFKQWDAIEDTNSFEPEDKIIAGFSKPNPIYGFSVLTALQFSFKVQERKDNAGNVHTIALRNNVKDFGFAFDHNADKNLSKKYKFLSQKLKAEEKESGAVLADDLIKAIKELSNE